jgi:hypothetical protein
MNTELLRANAQINETSSLAEREVLAATVFSPSVLGKLEADLRTPGSLLEGSNPTNKETAMLTKRLGLFAAERVVGFSPELASSITDQTIFVGGVCALSTRESTLAGIGKLEDPVTGEIRKAETDETLDISDVVTAVQVFETIGLTAESSAIVLEDTLWSSGVIEKLQASVGIDEAAAEQVSRAVQSRNERTFTALQRLRGFLFESPSNLAVVRDTFVMEELNSRTDEMLSKLGLPPAPEANDYRFVYAGMYSYVWRDILVNQGIVSEDQLMVIYEPWKHFAPEDNPEDKISSFRRELLKAAPFMQGGSSSEKLGLIAYMEPRDPNGRLVRKSVPTALLPNSKNYKGFDFGRFPVVPKKANALPTVGEFQFAGKTDETTLSKNPAFLWGLVYPPTAKTREVMQAMVTLSAEAKAKSKSAFQDNIALSAKEKQQLAAQLRGTFSREMGELSEQLIGEIETITNVLFGGDDATK